jgi:hypothetical protein
VTGLPGENAYELQVRGIPPNDETFVADTEGVYQLDSSGNIINSWIFGGADVEFPIFAMNFDPDGKSFWTADVSTGDVFKIVIADGSAPVHFQVPTFLASGITVKRSPLYTAVTGAPGGGSGVYRSDDWGKTWILMDPPTPLPMTNMNAFIGSPNTTNVKIAVGAKGNVVVAVTQSGMGNAGDLAGLFFSKDGGLTWNAVGTLPTTVEACGTFGINIGHQSNLHISVAADPSNDDVYYVGGDTQPDMNQGCNPYVQMFPNSVGSTNYTGRLFSVDTKNNTFAPITDNGTNNGTVAGETAPHADSRGMAFDANNQLIEIDDGGIYRQSSPGDNTGNWSSLIGNLQIGELHDTAFDTVSSIIIAGAQDTGLPQQSATGNVVYTEVFQGDGGDVTIDPTTSSPNSIRYESSAADTTMPNGLGLSAFRYNSANAFQSQFTPALTAAAPGYTAQFYSPIVVNRAAPIQMLFGFFDALYEPGNQGGNITALAPAITVNDGGLHHALIYGGTGGGVPNPSLIYAGTGNQVFSRVAAMSPLAATGALPGITTSVNDLAIDPTNDSHVFAIDDSDVWETTDGGAHWNAIDTSQLGAMGSNVGVFDSLAYVTVGGQSSIALGTNHGVYQSVIGSLGS